MSETSENEITQLIPEFLLDRQSRPCSKTTIRYYRVELGYFADWLENKSISEISPKTIKSFLIYKSATRNRGGVHSCYRAIRAFFNWYDNEHEPDKNPIRKVKVKKPDIEPLPEIPLESVQKLLNACKGRHKEEHTAIIKVLLDTGCRAFEFYNLNVCDVNLETGMVKILHGKGDKFRIVWLGNQSKKILESYLNSRKDLTPDSPLFETEDGTRYKYESLRGVIKRLCKNSGVKYTGLHAFRRTCALTLWRSNVDLLTISRYLGHKDIKTTLRYLNIGIEDIKDKVISPADKLN